MQPSSILAADVLTLRRALEQGLFIDTPAALAWVALDAAGLAGGFREAVRAAGGPVAVLQRRAIAAFSTPRQRTRVLNPEGIAIRLEQLLPWLDVGVGIVADDDRLVRFVDHPVCAFFRFGAELPDPTRPVVAIVGSRQAGPQTLARTAALAASLSKQGAVIVSGGAAGIDSAAQQGARAVGGDVVVITGRNLHGRAAVPDEVVVDPGLCWLSPYAPWAAPGAVKSRFAQRNAYIAAMADVVVAVCGATTSGTRHTVEAALRFGRPIVSLKPDGTDLELGAIAERLVETGTGQLIDDDVDLTTLQGLHRGIVPGAAAAWLRGPDQPLLPLSLSAARVPEPRSVDGPGAHVDDAPLLRLLWTRGALTIDDAASALSTSVRELLVDVATLELDGALRREGALLTLSSAACKA